MTRNRLPIALPVTHAAAPVDAADLDAAVATVRAAGLRATAARRLVLEALWKASEPLSAEQLSEAAGDGSDVASVYRNLEAFERIGLIRHFHVGHGPGLYARTSLGDREYLICDVCGRHEAVEPARLDRVRELIRRDFGHEASFTHFPIGGLCAACARKAGDGSATAGQREGS
jgi:Fur family transcriptional regulator, ferric uptake regulator